MQKVMNFVIAAIIVAGIGLTVSGVYQLSNLAEDTVTEAETQMPKYSCIQMGDQPKEDAACWRTEDGERVANYGQLKLSFGDDLAKRLIATRS